MISKFKAQLIAASWHSGQWSALYQFASTGIYLVENHFRYLQEVENNLNPGSAHSQNLFKKDELRLNELKSYFIKQGERQQIKRTTKKIGFKDMPNDISQIAAIIQNNWKNISPKAINHLKAMHRLHSIYDYHNKDSAKSVIKKILNNAKYWRGEVAREVKQKLKEMID